MYDLGIGVIELRWSIKKKTTLIRHKRHVGVDIKHKQILSSREVQESESESESESERYNFVLHRKDDVIVLVCDSMSAMFVHMYWKHNEWLSRNSNCIYRAYFSFVCSNFLHVLAKGVDKALTHQSMSCETNRCCMRVHRIEQQLELNLMECEACSKGNGKRQDCRRSCADDVLVRYRILIIVEQDYLVTIVRDKNILRSHSMCCSCIITSPVSSFFRRSVFTTKIADMLMFYFRLLLSIFPCAIFAQRWGAERT